MSNAPGDARELQGYLDRDRQDYYLDGPNDVDWLFRNEIIHNREAALYVDYVAHDDGHTRLHPGIYDDPAFGLFSDREPSALRMAGLLRDVGISSPDALAVVAEYWRPLQIGLEMTWMQLRHLNDETLKCLESRSLLKEREDRDYQEIIDYWPFPLYPLDVSLLRVDVAALRERQRLWNPGW